ncbi:hypothetical protein KAR91_50625 [Candidatus Pacearchaeota archaeon]|nr:hypothetical protein [Candidatus Pacearchaeota archaeon]
MSHEYPNLRRARWDFGDDYGKATFVPVCEKCGRFVKAPELMSMNEVDQPHAKCSRCGETRMQFEGFF